MSNVLGCLTAARERFRIDTYVVSNQRGKHVTNKIIEAMAGVEVAAIEHATGRVSDKRLRAARMALLEAVEAAILLARGSAS